MKLKGRAGAYTFYSSKGRQIARVSQNSTNYGDSARRSLAQQTRRVKWSNLVNFWKLTSGVLKGSFESKRANETDYNAFMRKNLGQATIAFTKEMAARSCCLPEEFVISEGSLPEVTAAWGSTSEPTSLFTSLMFQTAESKQIQTVAELSAGLILQNPEIKAGFQITLILVGIALHPWGPTSELVAAEVTLDTEDTRDLAEVFNGFEIWADESGRIKFFDLDGYSAGAVILSDSTRGKLRVSTASLALTNTTEQQKYSTEAAVAAAIESYGLDPERFLDSGDYQG